MAWHDIFLLPTLSCYSDLSLIHINLANLLYMLEKEWWPYIPFSFLTFWCNPTLHPVLLVFVLSLCSTACSVNGFLILYTHIKPQLWANKMFQGPYVHGFWPTLFLTHITSKTLSTGSAGLQQEKYFHSYVYRSPDDNSGWWTNVIVFIFTFAKTQKPESNSKPILLFYLHTCNLAWAICALYVCILLCKLWEGLHSERDSLAAQVCDCEWSAFN